MKPSGLLRIAMLCCTLLVFYLGAHYVLESQRGSSEVYPRFSTYRNDPQGYRVLYEALNRLPDLSVIRNQRQLAMLPLEQTGVLILSDAVSSPDPASVIERIEAFIEEGGRLVIAYSPLLAGSRPEADDLDAWMEDDATEDSEASAPEQNPEAANDDESAADAEDADLDPEWLLMNLVDVETRWGVSLGVLPLDVEHDDNRDLFEAAQAATPQQVLATEGDRVPAALPWRSARYFEGDDELWNVWYRYTSGEAAIIERRLGAGSIVMLGDSFLLSNESLAADPIAPFLARLIGSHKVVIFDEWTKGVRDDPWLIDLIRRYRLDGVLAGLVVVALLIVWRSALPLPPRPSLAQREHQVAQDQKRKSPIGLAALIERNIERKALPGVCFTAWDQAFRQDRRYDASFRAQLQDVLCREGPESPLERYQAAARLIEERKHYRD